jgi:hypothetical protein
VERVGSEGEGEWVKATAVTERELAPAASTVREGALSGFMPQKPRRWLHREQPRSPLDAEGTGSADSPANS